MPTKRAATPSRPAPSRSKAPRPSRRAHAAPEKAANLLEVAAKAGVVFDWYPRRWNAGAYAMGMSASMIVRLLEIGEDAFICERFDIPPEHYQRFIAWGGGGGGCTGSKKDGGRCRNPVRHLEGGFEEIAVFEFGHDDRCPHHGGPPWGSRSPRWRAARAAQQAVEDTTPEAREA
jgi:hypothetical protein